MAPTNFTFLHAADLHLDSPLTGLEKYEGAPAEELRLATRGAFERLVALAIEREVKFVVIAGDVFDGDWPDFNSGLWFLERLRELTAAGIEVFLLRGNHDAASKVTRDLSLPDGVHRFSDKKPKTFRLDDLDVALHGQSYPTQAVTDNLARDYPDRVEGALNIGVLHTSLGGYAAHESYAPCTLADLTAKGYDYWALGHVHQYEVVSEDPWIVFPGSIQGRHARETGAKGVTLVHVEDGAVARIEHVDCDVARWEVVDVDLSGLEIDEEHRVEDRVREGLERATLSAGGRLLAARVRLVGETALDAVLRSRSARWIAQIRAVASSLDRDTWVEKVRVETSAPVPKSTPSGFAELARTVLGSDLDPADAEAIGEECEKLVTRLENSRIDTGVMLGPDAVARAVEPARRYLASLLTGRPDAPSEEAEA